MRVLMLCSGFNGLTQRLHRELAIREHVVSVEIAASPEAMQDAVALFRPDIIICPYLKQRVPDTIWQRHVCLIVHPGIEGDRGPSALDWAISGAQAQWGVTLLHAAEDMDAGDIWGTRTFNLRNASKGSTYRREVTEHAVELVLTAIEQASDPEFHPRPLNYGNPNVTGRWNRPMRQEDRAIDWSAQSTEQILRTIRAADGAPGVLDEVGGEPVYLFGAHRAIGLQGTPGALLAQSHGAVCRATIDGALWISHLKSAAGGKRGIKLPATQVLGAPTASLPHIETDGIGASNPGCAEIRYYEIGEVGYLHFDFYNGAMSTTQCRRLSAMLAQIKRRPIKVIALMGGDEFWSNGIHLNCIEAAPNAAEESWANINAMNDVVREILEADKQLTVAAVRSNAGAGGAVMAAACDHVWIRSGVVLNVHYQTMGLYGSEYWTYVLPRRVGAQQATRLTEQCLPTLAKEARDMGLADRLLPEHWTYCEREIDQLCAELCEPEEWKRAMNRKLKTRARDERRKPLQQYRDEELRHMHRTFHDVHSSYHEARRRFVLKTPAQTTPERIATHRAAKMRRTA